MKKLIIMLFFVCSIGCAVLEPFSGVAGFIKDQFITWKEGEASKCYPFNQEITRKIVVQAAEELHLKIEKNETGYVLARGDNKFKIKIEKRENNISDVRIRINFWGDVKFAELIYKKIDDQIDTIKFNK